MLLWTGLHLVRHQGNTGLGADVHSYESRGAGGRTQTTDWHKTVCESPVQPSVTAHSRIKPDQSCPLRLVLWTYLQYLRIEIN